MRIRRSLVCAGQHFPQPAVDVILQHGRHLVERLRIDDVAQRVSKKSRLEIQIAQRSARTILPASVLRDHGFATGYDLEAYEPVGCARCGGSGYKGRIGLYEVMPVTEEIRTLAIERASADRVAAVAVRSGMRRLRDDGLDKVRHGVTSIAEVSRVTSAGG